MKSDTVILLVSPLMETILQQAQRCRTAGITFYDVHFRIRLGFPARFIDDSVIV